MMNKETPIPINWANKVPHGTCPQCGAIVMPYIDSPKPNYCHWCGQKLSLGGKAPLNITPCEGEGQGSCKRCTDNGKWNRMWMCFLYRIEGYEGVYCSDCVAAIQEEMKNSKIPNSNI